MMGVKKILGLGLLLLTSMALFKDFFVLLITVVILFFVLKFVVRFLADIFWWGKGKGKW